MMSCSSRAIRARSSSTACRAAAACSCSSCRACSSAERARATGRRSSTPATQAIDMKLIDRDRLTPGVVRVPPGRQAADRQDDQQAAAWLSGDEVR